MNKSQAQKDYERFWNKHPDQKNPSDINTIEKFNFAVSIGWTRLREMQRARKQGAPYTKRDK